MRFTFLFSKRTIEKLFVSNHLFPPHIYFLSHFHKYSNPRFFHSAKDYHPIIDHHPLITPESPPILRKNPPNYNIHTPFRDNFSLITYRVRRISLYPSPSVIARRFLVDPSHVSRFHVTVEDRWQPIEGPNLRRGARPMANLHFVKRRLSSGRCERKLDAPPCRVPHFSLFSKGSPAFVRAITADLIEKCRAITERDPRSRVTKCGNDRLLRASDKSLVRDSPVRKKVRRERFIDRRTNLLNRRFETWRSIFDIRIKRIRNFRKFRF